MVQVAYTIVVTKHPAAQAGEECEEIDSIIVNFRRSRTVFCGSTEAHDEK